MHESDNTFAFQLYGEGTNYGFLDNNWGSWDIRKAINGAFYVDEGSGLQRVWNAGNDGSGSGLDADLLDGQHGSYYKDTPSGTVVVFYQSSAPTGWTKSTSHDNKASRVVSGTGGGSGGSNNFTTAFNSSRGTSGGSVNNHTLSTSQMPSHQHHGRAPNHDTNSSSSQGYPYNNNHNAFRTSDRA